MPLKVTQATQREMAVLRTRRFLSKKAAWTTQYDLLLSLVIDQVEVHPPALGMVYDSTPLLYGYKAT